MKTRELERLSDLLLAFYVDEASVACRIDVSRVRSAVLDKLDARDQSRRQGDRRRDTGGRP